MPAAELLRRVVCLADFLLLDVRPDVDGADVVGVEEVVSYVEFAHVEGDEEPGVVGGEVGRWSHEGDCEFRPSLRVSLYATMCSRTVSYRNTCLVPNLISFSVVEAAMMAEETGMGTRLRIEGHLGPLPKE